MSSATTTFITRTRSAISAARSLLKPFSSSSTSTTTTPTPLSPKEAARRFRYSYILAPDTLQPGQKLLNLSSTTPPTTAFQHNMLDPLSQPGNSLPLAAMRLGTFVHCVEHRPGEGGKFVRAAGTSAKILRLGDDGKCVLRMPSGREKQFDSRCRATIGRVSNPGRKHRRMRKAGESRWAGRRPVVRGVAMNPVDHPHGGGEGRTSGGRPSVSPWGKPTKGGYKTVLKKNHDTRELGKKRKGRRG